jgi:flagellum-specific peptidoglycan hydrolase FlgJ
VGLLPPASKPWWQQATALVSLGAGGVVTGLSFVPKASADVSSPASMPINLLALKHSVRPTSNGDARLRSAIVNVADYYRQLAEEKSPAEMEALIWQHDSIDGANHGPSCAAFASLTLHLASQVVGEQSWVTGGSTYPWPLHDWADVRVDPNPDSLGVTSIVQDAKAHGRWHPLGAGYRPQPGDWVLFDGHIEVVTEYTGGVLHTVGADSLPNYSVNAHRYAGSLSGQGVTGFVNNGTVRAPRHAPATAAAAGHGGRNTGGSGRSGHEHGQQAGSGQPGATVAQGSGDGLPTPRSLAAGLADIPGSAVPAAARPRARAAGLADIPGTEGPGPRRRPDGPRAGQHAQHGQQAQHRSRTAGGGPASGRPGHRAGRGPGPAGAHPARDASGADTAPGTAAIPGLQVAAQRSKPSGTAVPAGPYRRHQPVAGTGQASDSSAQQAFIDAVAPGAVAAQSRYGVPAAVTIAQAIEESGWGQSSLATQDNNLFGIKGSGPAGSDAQPTQEYLNGGWVDTTAGFAVYRNVAESITDHGRLLATSGYYTRAMAVRHSPNAFADALTGVYATDPGYGSKIIGLMRQYNLYRYDLAGRVPARSGHPGPAGGSGGTGATTTAGGASIPGLPGSPAGPASPPAPHRKPGRPPRPVPSPPARPSPAPSSPGPASPAPSTPAPGASTPAPAASTPAPGVPTPGPTGPTPAPVPATSAPATAPAGTPTPASGTPTAAAGTPSGVTGSPAGGSHSPAGAGAAAAPAMPAPRASSPATGSAGPGTPGTGSAAAGDPAAQPAIPGIPAAAAQSGAPAQEPRPAAGRPTPGGPASGAAPAGTAPATAGQGASSRRATARATVSAAPTAETMAVRRLATPEPPRPRAPVTSRATAASRRAAAPAPTAAPARTAPAGRTTPAGRTAAPARTAASTGTPGTARRGSAPAAPARAPAPARPRRGTVRPASATSRAYQHRMPTAVSNGVTLARVQLSRDEPLYRDVATQRDISWKLLAAVDWMQCKARPGYSAVLGEKLGSVNPDGTIYLTRSEALHQCADDLADLALAVYQIDLTTRQPLSVGELANVFAAFRWGGLLRVHHTSAMEFPYSVAGLTEQHVNMRWPRIAEPNSPDKPGARFRQPFGAVPLVLGLHYPATV